MKVPNFKENKGITLAALVITIIVLLIIATITVTTLSGNNGIVEQTVTAKEESEIKSELKVVDLASNQAKNKNKYGDVTGEELVKALKNNAGEDQTEVEYYEKGSLYFVTFKKSNRVYEVTTAGYAKYVGKPEDAVVLFGKPKSSIAPKTSIEVNVIIKTLQENKIDKLEYVWNKSEDKQPSKEEFSNNTPKVLENVENEKTEKQTIVSLPEGTPEGEYYLWVKVTNNGEETIEHLGPYIIGEVSCQLAVDPNGGTWDGSSEVKVIKQSVGNKIDLKTPNPPANYEITFDADGGNVSKDKVTSVVSFNRWELKGVGTLEKNIYTFGKGKATATAQYSNEKITLPTATKEGYQIDGWYDKDGNKAGDPNEEYDPKGSEKLTAHWTPKSYELAFDYKTNGGISGPDETQQIVYGKEVILSTYQAERGNGYDFIGWNRNANDKTALDKIIMGAQNEKVYALFKKDIKLTFKDKNGDKYSNPNPVTIYNNEKGTATAPEISEYTGWEPLYWTKETKADGAKSVGAKAGDNTISNITDPATYYARYKKDIKIEFDLNGGTGKKPDDIPGVVQVSTSDITKPKAATIDMPEIASGNEPKKAGYVFNGWNTAQDGKGTHYDIEETGSFVDNTTLYAEWTEKKATKITLNKETATITYGDTTTIIATLEPADLVNKNVNWTTSDANICNINKAISVSGEEITLTAKKIGKATITATAADGSGKTASCTVTVVAKKIAIPTAKTNLVYNGENQTGVEQTTEYNVTDGTKIDAGSYTAKAVLKDKINTMWNDETTTDKTVDWSITKKDITVEWKEQASWGYDGNAHKPEVNTPINGAKDEKIHLIVEGEKINVGTDYTATAKISSVEGGQENANNYNLKETTKKFSIREAVIIGKVKINGKNTYGETLTAQVSELDPADATLKYQWFSNDTESTTGGTKLTELQDSNTYTIGKGLVGKYIYVVVTATKPNFNSATFKDLTDNENNTTETVSAKEIDAPTAKTGLIYNGQNQTGVENGSGYTVTDGTKKDAGNYTANVELEDKENTVWSDGTTDDKSMPWSIAKKAITVKADNKTKAYGEDNPELTATVGETGVQGETLKTSGQLKTTAEKTSNVGTYPITQGTLKLTDNGSFKASNYTINYTDGTLTITKIDNTLDVKAKTLTYNTQEQELVSQTGLQGDIYYSIGTELTESNYTEKGTKNEIPKATDAGSYKVYYYAPGNENYNAKSDSVDVTIAQYSLNNAIIETVGSQIFTGSAITPKPEVKVNIPSEQNKTTLVEGRDFEYSYKDNTAVGTATITITGKGNYKDSKPITFNIENKKQIKVSKTDYTGTYDGKSHTFNFDVTEPTSGCTVYYKEGTTPLTANNYEEGTTEEKPTRTNAGTTTVQWYIHTTNVQYADTNGSIEITINPKSIDVTADNKTKKYGEENPTLTATAGETGITGETAKIAGALKTTATKTSNVGTYVIGNDNVELKDNGTFKSSNYEMNFINGTLTITKADNTLKVNAKTLTYNTTAQELVKEENKQGDVYYSIGTELTADNYNTAGRTTIPTGTNAGDYKVYYYTPGNTNYASKSGSVDVTIGKYNLSNANMTQGALDYTGSQLKPTPTVTVNIPSEQNKTTLTAGTEFIYSYGANTNAGTNAGSVTITAKDNTNYTGSKTATFNINKIANTIDVRARTLTYNTLAQELVTEANRQGDVYYSVGTELTASNYTEKGTKNTIPKETNAGSYKVYYYAPGNTNYNAKDGFVDVTIEKYSLNNAEIDSVNAQIYTGSAVTPKPEVKVNIPSEQNKTKLVEGTDFDYSYSNNNGVGTATITVTGKGNYKDSKSKTFQIIDKTPITVDEENYTGTYNGQSHTFTLNVTDPTSGYTVYYKEGTEPLTASNYTQGTTTTKPKRTDAGTTTVQWYIHTTNATYSDLAGNNTITINKKSINVTADNKSRVYGEANPELTVTIGNTGITGEAGKVSGAPTTSATATSNVGTYDIAQGTLALTDNGTFKASNYTMNYVKGTLTITAKENPVVVSPRTLTYNTLSQELVTVENVEGDIYYSVGTALTSDNFESKGTKTIPSRIDAGTYKVYYYVTGTNNYSEKSGSVDVTIEKYNLSNANISQGALNYTGSKLTPTPEVTVNIPSTTNKTKLTAGEEFEYSYGANTNAGTNAGKVTITAKENTNYTGSKTVNFTINKLANPLEVTAKTLTYNATEQVLVNQTGLQGDIYYSVGTALTSSNYTTEGTKITKPSRTDAGTYTVYYYAPGNTNYNAKSGSVDVTIEKYNLSNATIATIGAKTYTGSAITPTPDVSVPIPSGTTTILVNNTDFTFGYENNINVGTATIKVIAKDNSNYTGTKTGTFKIDAKKEIKVTSENYTGNYDGNAHTFTLNVTEPTSGCTIYFKEGTTPLTESNYTQGTTQTKPTRTKAGTTTVQWYIHTTNATYNDLAGSNTIKINSIPATKPTVTAYSGAYDGKTHGVTVTGGSGGTIKYSENNNDWSTTAPTYKDFTDGAKTIYVKVEGDENHSDSEVVTSSITINKKSITVTAANKSKVYGTANPTLTVTIGNTGITGETGKVSGTPTTTATTTSDVGTYVIGKGEVELTDNGTFKAENYAMNFVNGTLTITKAKATKPTVTAYNEAYDGASHGVTVSGGSGGTVKYSTDNSTWTETAPTYKDFTDGAKTIYVKVEGDENHSDSEVVTSSITINKKSITVTAANKSKVYGTANPTFTATVEATGVTGETGKVSGAPTTSATTISDVGTYDITQGTLALADNGTFKASNYTMNYVKGTLTITKAKATKPTVTAYNEAYDGASHGVTVSGGSGGTVKYSTDNSTWTETAPTYKDFTNGAKTVYVKVVGDSNHSDSDVVTSSITINKKSITVTADNKSRAYGAANPIFTATVGATGVTGETGKVSGAPTTSATTTSDVGTYDITQGTLALADNGTFKESNYTMNYVKGTLTISKKSIIVTAEDKNRAYEATNPELTYTHSGEVSGQTAGFTGSLATSATTTSAPGNYDITQGDLALTDNGTFKASNYKIEYTNATLRVDPKVTFNANGGTGTMSAQTVTYNKATALKQNTITREGYEFIGWNTEADGSGTTYANKANITATANTILYAQWKYIATPNISVTDIDTFSYSAIAGAAYYVSTTQTTAPTAGTTASSSTFALNTWTSATNTGDLSLASGQIYYVWVKDEKGNVSPNKASISVLEYKVNYYKHIVGSNTTGILFNSNYSKNSETTKYALTGAVVTESNADLNINIDGYTYEGEDNETLGQMYIGDLGTESEIAKPSSGAVTEKTISSSGIIINLFYRANRLFVKYNVNGCTLVPSVDQNTGTITNLFGLDSDGFVKYLNNTNSLTDKKKKAMQVMYLTEGDGTKEWLGVYGGDANCINNADTYLTNYAGLSNYNNASYINITPSSGCTISTDKSWKAYKPDGTEVYYDQDKLNYMSENFAEIAGQDLKAGDVTIELYVNWWGASGWNQREGYWYYYNNSMRKKGWINNEDRWFYCYDSSKNVLINDETPTIPDYAMVTGWLKDIDGNKYFFSRTKDNTFAYGQMRTGWLQQDGYWYYLAINIQGHKTGSMLKSCSCTIGTKIYTFDAFGRCTNP